MGNGIKIFSTTKVLDGSLEATIKANNSILNEIGEWPRYRTDFLDRENFIQSRNLKIFLIARVS